MLTIRHINGSDFFHMLRITGNSDSGIWAYARVSTEEQAQDTGALTKQIKRLVNAGAERIYYDVESRSSPSRKEYLQLIKDVNASKIGTIKDFIFIRIDRISANSISFYELMGTLQRHKIQIKALDEPFDIDSIGGQLTIDVRLAAAKYEVNMTSLRVSKHNEIKLKQKKAHTKAPFGWKVENDIYVKDTSPCVCLIEGKRELTVNDVAVLVVQTFFDVRTMAKTEQRLHEMFGIEVKAQTKFLDKSVREIVINDESDLNKLGKKVTNVSAGLRWTRSGLRQWLVNPVLAGGIPTQTTHRDNSVTGKKKFKHRLPSDQWGIIWIDDAEWAIITQSQHNDIKNILKQNRNNSWASDTRHSENDINIFSGLLKCSMCGASYTRCSAKSRKSGERKYHYQCSFYQSRKCTQKKMIINNKLEQQVIEALVNMAENLAGMVDAINPDDITESEEIVTLRRQLESLEAIPGNNQAINEAKENIKQQLATLLTLNSNQSIQKTLIKSELVAMFNDSDFWYGLSMKDKKSVLGRLLRQIVIDGDRVVRIDLL